MVEIDITYSIPSLVIGGLAAFSGLGLAVYSILDARRWDVRRRRNNNYQVRFDFGRNGELYVIKPRNVYKF